MSQLNKKQSIYILAIILTVLQLFFNKNNPIPKISLIPTNVPAPTCRSQACLTRTKVIRVIDGDTIEIKGKQKVRYIGINTPEIYHDTTGKKTGEQCFANESYFENKKLVEGKEIFIQKDVSEVDKYKRLLCYVWVGGTFVNDYLVRQGFAQVSTFPPDVKYQQQFLEAQEEAKVNNRGLWKECPIKY